MILFPPTKRLFLLLALLLTACYPAGSQAAPAKPSTNAFDYYEQAGQALVDGEQIGSITRTTKANKVISILTNRKALQLLHEGFKYPYYKPFVPSAFGIFESGIEFKHGRDLARLMVLEGAVRAAHGDQTGAVDSYLGAIQLGVDNVRGSGVIALLSGFALESIGRQPIWTSVSQLTGQQAKAAAQRLEFIESRRAAYRDVLQAEKQSAQRYLKVLFKSNQWRKAYKTSKSGPQILQDFTHSMDVLIAAASLPYPARKLPYSFPQDPINQLFLSNYATAENGRGFFDAKTHTENALLLVMLGLQAYKMEHHLYPQTLAQLVPAYLHKIPLDPFALSGPLRYRLKDDAYLLYSIGPDGKDNGGQPVHDSQKNPRQPYHVASESKGDMVAGINTR